MSRIIVKNLPKGITAKKLEDLFSSKGFITDLQLKYNKQGVFRQFAFIGYKTEEEAQNAKKYFHNTFVNTSKITVEICSNLGDAEALKKHKKGVLPSPKAKQEDSDTTKTKHESTKKQFDFPEDLKDDPKFKEYLGVNEDRLSKPVWAEDVDTNIDLENENEENDSSQDEGSSDQDESDSVQDEKDVSGDDKKSSENIQNKAIIKVKTFDDKFTIKIRNLPYQCKKSQVKKFFHPLKISSLRLPPRSKGFAYVSFKTEKDLKRALIKHRGFLDGHRVDVIKYTKKDLSDQLQNDKFKGNDKTLNEELLAETGRIYVRNLCYSVTENEVKELFSKYGPVEVHVPIDFTTRTSKGFAFVTFMFAEHAVKAFTELDGKIFQGRNLHLIPAQPKKEYEIDENETNFKKKKEAKRKKESGSSHNWNILFLGMNAVADAIASKHGIEKSKLLSGDSRGSVAVRMALAETKMVETTRKFLVENGVQLDAFSQPAAERSKTVIVVKHLPANTSAEEINELFNKHGTVSRVLVPPTGMVALVEFENPSEAKVAFTKLAYKQFHKEPLFLEWAPMGGLTDPPAKTEKESLPNKEKEQGNESNENKLSSEIEEDIPPEIGSTIYVKNINFNTTQEAFRKHFKQCGPIYSATISMRTDTKTGKQLSMGFGFVQFAKKESAIFALQNLQKSVLNGHSLELKFANRSINPNHTIKRKKYEVQKQTSSKIIVKNIPFQASVQEVKELFTAFGSLINVRLPKKLGKPNEHRGFGFVEYATKEDAERAFQALCHSTHLFNRRLVLNWANVDSESVSEIRKKTAHDFVESEPKKKVKKSKLKEDAVVAARKYDTEQGEN